MEDFDCGWANGCYYFGVMLLFWELAAHYYSELAAHYYINA